MYLQSCVCSHRQGQQSPGYPDVQSASFRGINDRREEEK
jgi:hypothetical protein